MDVKVCSKYEQPWHLWSLRGSSQPPNLGQPRAPVLKSWSPRSSNPPIPQGSKLAVYSNIPMQPVWFTYFSLYIIHCTPAPYQCEIKGLRKKVVFFFFSSNVSLKRWCGTLLFLCLTNMYPSPILKIVLHIPACPQHYCQHWGYSQPYFSHFYIILKGYLSKVNSIYLYLIK